MEILVAAVTDIRAALQLLVIHIDVDDHDDRQRRAIDGVHSERV